MKTKKTILLIICCLFVLPKLSIAQNKSDDIIIGKYDKLYSKILNEERTLLVSLPDGYEGSLGKYPVLFLLDGNVSALSEMYSISRSIGYSSLPPMIIVAIQNT
ncbi:alpha/beta hydrolase-fold protein, partial [Bacteroidota bacterium]